MLLVGHRAAELVPQAARRGRRQLVQWIQPSDDLGISRLGGNRLAAVAAAAAAAAALRALARPLALLAVAVVVVGAAAAAAAADVSSLE